MGLSICCTVPAYPLFSGTLNRGDPGRGVEVTEAIRPKRPKKEENKSEHEEVIMSYAPDGRTAGIARERGIVEDPFLPSRHHSLLLEVGQECWETSAGVENENIKK